MEYKAIFSQVFEAMGMPVVIGSFDEDETPEFPFIEYHRLARDNFDADNMAYYKTDNWQISLYSKKKDAPAHWDLTDRMEGLLEGHGILCRVSEDIFPDNNIIYTTFDIALPR